MALVAATMRLRRLVIRARIIVELANLWISSRSLPPEGGSHASEELKFELLFSAKRGFRLQPEGCGCRQSLRIQWYRNGHAG
jgi:hypothetical protein